MDYFKHRLYREEIRKIAAGICRTDSFRGKSVAVTGARGLVGSELVDVLMYANGAWGLNCRVYAIVRDLPKAECRFAGYLDSGYFKLFRADLNKEAVGIEGNVDYFIHAASNTHPLYYASKPVETILTNTLGTCNTLEFAAAHQCSRYVFLSSVEIYGENRGDTQAFAEDYCGYIDCNTLRAGYPEGKRTGEALCRAYASERKLDYVVARLARCYGPGLLAEDTKALSQFLANALAGEDIMLKSSGEQMYTYLYAADAVAAVLFLAGNGESGEAYNIAGKDSDIRLGRLAEMVAKKAGTKVVSGRPGRQEAAGYSKAGRAVLDGSKLRRLGWEPQVSLEEGIGRTLAMRGVWKGDGNDMWNSADGAL